MTGPRPNLCDQSLVDLQNALDRRRSDPGVVLADHVVMESSVAAGAEAQAWAIPAGAITETMICPAITRVGIAPGFFMGIAATRARLVTVIDAVHMLTGHAPVRDGRGWLTLVDPAMSAGHGIGLWWPSFRGIVPVGAMPKLGQSSAPPLLQPEMVIDWRIESSPQPDAADHILARVDVHAMVAAITTGRWWEDTGA